MEILINEEIVGDVIDTLPKEILSVKFHIKNKEGEVNLGNKLLIQDVSSEPVEVTWYSHPHKFYTLCLTDPDAPTRLRPQMRERVHWLVGNIPGHSKNVSKEGETLMEYVPSCPPKGSGFHRYTFVLYEQPTKIDFKTEKKLDRSKELWDLRRNFSIREFALKYSLGNPIGVNFYTAEWDEDAEITRRELGLF